VGRLLRAILPALRRRQLKTRLNEEEGAELVEFALASTVFFMFVFGFMELCTALFMYTSVAEAAREASRWASVRGASSSVTSNGVTSCANPYITQCPATATQVQNYTKTFVGGPGMTAQVWWCNSDGQTNCVQDNSNALKGNIVKVKVFYNFATLPFVAKSGLTVASTSEMVIWQ
jgi:Flp pilus assembly protein TadG